MAFITKSQQSTKSPIVDQFIKVSKATATLPATTTQSLFTVSGGRVLVKYLVGEAVTAFDGTATNLKATFVPTTGTAADIAANLAVASLEAATLLVVEGDATAVIGVSAGYAPALNALPFILGNGTIRIETSATNAGTAKWDIWYLPLDPGAKITAVV